MFWIKFDASTKIIPSSAPEKMDTCWQMCQKSYEIVKWRCHIWFGHDWLNKSFFFKTALKLTEKNAETHLKNSNLPYEKTLKLYHIFKDCDGLDRIRFDGLNLDYIRNIEAKDMVDIAYDLLISKFVD